MTLFFSGFTIGVRILHTVDLFFKNKMKLLVRDKKLVRN